MSSHFIDTIFGDDEARNDTDMLIQTRRLPLHQMPSGEGWRIMTGNAHDNLWARAVYRYEISQIGRDEKLGRPNIRGLANPF